MKIEELREIERIIAEIGILFVVVLAIVIELVIK